MHSPLTKNLPVAEAYDVYLDETATKEMEHNGVKEIVAFIVPEGASLPDLSGTHAAEDFSEMNPNRKNPEECFRQDFATLGKIPHSFLRLRLKWEKSTSDFWMHQMAGALEIVAKLLSAHADGALKRLRCFIENYGDYESRSEKSKTILNYIKDGFAEIELNPAIVEKECSGTVYADRFAWYGNRLPEACGFKKFYNLDEQRKQLRDAEGGKHVQLSRIDWEKLLDESNDGQIFREKILKDQAELCRKKIDVWEIYLAYAQKHLDSETPKMKLLREQIRWLDACRPARILPRCQHLQFLSLRFQFASRCGEDPGKTADELEKLATELKRADFVSYLDALLNLAEAKTNVFRFSEAQALLDSFVREHQTALDVLSAEHRGLIESALGSYKAFLGNPDGARKHFHAALKHFEEFAKADPESAKRTFPRVHAYDLVAQMDLALRLEMANSPEFEQTLADAKKQLDQAIREYVGEDDLQKFAERISKSGSGKECYIHQIFLRYCVCGFAEKKVLQAYEKNRQHWELAGEDFHPWELIRFYRYLLFGDEKEFDRALKICASNENGVTLRCIAAVFCVARPQELKKLLAEHRADLERVLPKATFRELLRRRDKPPPPREEATKIIFTLLPFNFK